MFLPYGININAGATGRSPLLGKTFHFFLAMFHLQAYGSVRTSSGTAPPANNSPYAY